MKFSTRGVKGLTSRACRAGLAVLVVGSALTSGTSGMRASSARAQAITGESSSRTNVAATNGPLRVSSANGRYFVDASGKPVYLTGMHNWDVLQDSGESDPPPAMPYESYLNQMAAQGQNL